ncbi:DUF2130 domain-containing protein, partial [Acidithiobacillus caldus]
STLFSGAITPTIGGAILPASDTRAQWEQERQQSVADKEAVIARLQAQIASLSELSEAKLLNQLQRVAAEKDAEIQKLQAQVQAHDTSKALAIRESIESVQQERDALRAALDRAALEKELAEKALIEKYQTQIRDRDEAIERLRDMKARLSTKMLGETLEQHCEVTFNQIRATAFPNAYFEKDTDARTGSKGDYIFRDFDHTDPANPIEIVSIMFEMKNEADTTTTKKRNEDFFKELDKDRTEKGCEYARCWSHSWNPITSCTTPASSTSRTDTPRCTSSGRSSSSP